MPYGNDPGHDPLDHVRFLVGDTSTSTPDLSDEEVAFLLDTEGSPTRAAARAAETLSARYSKTASEKRVGPLTIIQGTRAMSKSMEFGRLAKLLWARAASGDSTPYAGGTSLNDKSIRQTDPDRVKPSFSRRMMEYPTGSTSQADPDDLRP